MCDVTESNEIEISLCGGIADTADMNGEIFAKGRISYDQLCANPALLQHKDLLFKINKKFYPWMVYFINT